MIRKAFETEFKSTYEAALERGSRTASLSDVSSWSPFSR